MRGLIDTHAQSISAPLYIQKLVAETAIQILIVYMCMKCCQASDINLRYETINIFIYLFILYTYLFIKSTLRLIACFKPYLM